MAIITSFQAPNSLDELVERLSNGGMTPIERVLNGGKDFGDWAVDEGCPVDDVVFFLCGQSSIDAIAHVFKEATNSADKDLRAYAKRELMLHKCYAGNIVAVGRVASLPSKVTPGHEDNLVPGSWHAEIGSFHLLKNPISVDKFDSFVTLNQSDAVTKLDAEQASKLLSIVMFGNLR